MRKFYLSLRSLCCFFNDTATTEIYTLSLHDALPISGVFISPSPEYRRVNISAAAAEALNSSRSEEHTSELQSRFDHVCRLLLEKKKQSVPARSQNKKKKKKKKPDKTSTQR